MVNWFLIMVTVKPMQSKLSYWYSDHEIKIFHEKGIILVVDRPCTL